MSLNRLTMRAKKSLSGLFSSGEAQGSSPNETTKPAPNKKENDTPDLEDFGSAVPYPEHVCPDRNKPSPSKDSPSRHKKLMGSLRRGSLQSMSSLRSLRSPSKKTQKHDETPHQPESPCTPTRHTAESLALPKFEESPSGQPMFDIPRHRRSISSSLIVHHSSPIGVPPSTKQEAAFGTPVHLSLLPTGTIPSSPAPLQKAMDRDSANMAPSPASSSVPNLSAMTEPVSTPMPGTNLTLEDIQPDVGVAPSSAKPSQEHSSYFDIPLNSQHEKPVQTSFHLDREIVRDAGAKAMENLLAKLNGINSSEDTAKPIHEMGPQNYGQVDRSRDQRSMPLKPDGSEHGGPRDNIEHVVWTEDDPAFAAAEKLIADIAKATIGKGGSFADADKILAVAMAKLANGGSQSDDKVGWGRHTGLYDGSGYGEESRSIPSRPSTSTEEAPEITEVTASKTQEVRDTSLTVEVDTEPKPALSVPGHHETLAETIRTYAAYEKEGNSATTDKDSVADMKDSFHTTTEDVDRERGS